jgi:hypothetical protein
MLPKMLSEKNPQIMADLPEKREVVRQSCYPSRVPSVAFAESKTD